MITFCDKSGGRIILNLFERIYLKEEDQWLRLHENSKKKLLLVYSYI